jgi:hypothetical protein
MKYRDFPESVTVLAQQEAVSMPTAGSPTQTPLEDAAPRQRRWCKNFDLGGGESQITMRHSVAAVTDPP